MRVLVLIIVLLAAALRFNGLGDKSLWGDEIAQAVWSSWDWAQLWQQFRAPPDFISHFVLVHLAQLLGRDEFWIRLPSAVTSLLAVPLTYVVTKRMTDRLIGPVAMLLMAVAPYQIWYAQEARMYAALVCYALVGLYFFVRLVEGEPGQEMGDGSPRRSEWGMVLGMVVGNTLAIYTHLFGVFPILAEGVAAVGLLGARWIRERHVSLPRRTVLLAISFGVTFFLALPLLPGTMPYVLQGAEPAVSSEILSTAPFQLTGGFVWELVGDLGLGAREPGRTAISLALAVCGLGALAVRKPWAGWVAGVWLLLPLLVLAITRPGHGVSARYLIFLQPVYLMLISYAVVNGARLVYGWLAQLSCASSPGRLGLVPTALVVGGVLILGFVVVPPLMAVYPRAKLNDWRALARYIEAHGRAGDLVFGEKNTPNMNALTYYLPNLLRYNTPPTALETLKEARTGNRRMWYISTGEFFDPAGEAWAHKNLSVVPLAAWLEPTLDYARASEFEYTQSEHLATLYFRDGAIPSEIIYVGRQGFSNENIERLKMDPGEALETELQLHASSAPALEIEFSSKKAAQFDVLVNGELLAQVRESEAERGERSLAWQLPQGTTHALVRVVNSNTEFPLFIRRIAMAAAPSSLP